MFDVLQIRVICVIAWDGRELDLMTQEISFTFVSRCFSELSKDDALGGSWFRPRLKHCSWKTESVIASSGIIAALCAKTLFNWTEWLTKNVDNPLQFTI